MATSNTPIPVTAQCLCKINVFTCSITESQLPLQTRFCHCTSCRHATGALYSSVIDWPGSKDDFRAPSLLTYDFGPTLSIHFCGTCSTPIFFRAVLADTLAVFTGSLVNTPQAVTFKAFDHIFVGDTIDGGASPWLMAMNAGDALAPRWSGSRNTSERLDSSWPPVAALLKGDDRPGHDNIPLHCHCKGVKLVLGSGGTDFEAMNGDELPFFADPTTYKSLASFDACDSCRPMFGIDIVNWTFSLLKHVKFPDAGDTDFPCSTLALKDAVLAGDPRLGTLKMYASSPDVQRYFCSRCSATVFYAVDDRPELVDVAIGLLDAPDGARAESRLVWSLGSKIGGFEDMDAGWRERFVDTARRNAEEWRIERGYPKSWRRVAAEQ